MGHGVAAGTVAMADREGRTRYGILHAEGAGSSPHERRLAGSELAPDQHEIAADERRGQLGPERFRLVGSGRLHPAGSHYADSRACRRGAGTVPAPKNRPARGRMKRGPVVTPGGMETGPSSAARAR